ncbi:alpha-amylase [Clostridia bacterium]|nr:alpha-amylase [Clostridia bacterium]
MQATLYDSFSHYHKRPFGAIEQQTPCVFTLRFPGFMAVDTPMLVVSRPGVKEKFVPMEFCGMEARAFNIYTCTYSPHDTGVHHYYFAYMQNGVKKEIKRFGASEGLVVGEQNTKTGGELFQLTVYAAGMDTPDWLKGGMLYQVFPDRFAKYYHNEHDLSEEEYDQPSVPIDRQMHQNWDDIPEWRPNKDGKVTNSDYFGGNLRGIEQKLPYLQSIGVTCLYLCPIFEAHENHRYCTGCYERVDPLLGTEKDFVRLAKEADKRGIRIILDGVFSHTGADSVYFNKYGRYGEKTGAFRDPESPYREWYSFQHYPQVYESWWGFESLPNVIENNPAYTNYICGKAEEPEVPEITAIRDPVTKRHGGILQKWLELGAAGWRLDVADELPDEFIDNLHISVKTHNKDNVIYGEVWEDASNKESYGVRRRYLTGSQLDSVMNYPFAELILNYVKYGGADVFRDGVMTILEHYPKPSVDILMNFVSTHDTERAITRLTGEDIGNHDRQWQEVTTLTDVQYIFGKTLLQCAMVFQFFLPGIPCVYYGDEAGLEGYKDPFNRRTYPWGKEDTHLIEFTKELSAIRQSSKVFAKGNLRFLGLDDRHCIFSRTDEELGESVMIYLNKSKHARKFGLEFARDRVSSHGILRGEVHPEESDFITIPPYDFAAVKLILRPNSHHHMPENQIFAEEIKIY